jgi:hypothetical protein
VGGVSANSILSNDGQTFGHSLKVGRVQLLRFQLSEQSEDTWKEGAHLLGDWSNLRTFKLWATMTIRALSAGADKPVRECARALLRTLPFPELGEVSRDTLSKLGPHTLGVLSDGKTAESWDYSIAGIRGRLSLSPLENSADARLEWKAEVAVNPVENELWLKSFQKQLGKPSMILRATRPKSNEPLIRHVWEPTVGERLVVVLFAAREGKRSLYVSMIVPKEVSTPATLVKSGLLAPKR